MPLRTRIAPSPTGDPHVGTAYVALFNYALARNNGGQFILRIEDTDRQRSTLRSEQMIYDALQWLGLSWDEGPDIGGPHTPYRQSERTELYRHYAQELVDRGGAYPCFCTPERLQALREEQKASKQTVIGYDRRCRRLDPAESARRTQSGEPHVIRLAMPEVDELFVQDYLRGEIRFERPQLDDTILLKTDGFPTYHLANVVDDHLMQITHVLRAEEWLSSLPKHVVLYQAFGWEPPVFCHLPLLRNRDHSKISKRKNPVSLNYFKREGFLPEAMLNYLGLMGWSMPDGREVFDLNEFVENMTLDRISLGGPIFDIDKLRWLNGKHLRSLGPEKVLDRLRQHVLSDDYLLRVLPLCLERIETLGEFLDYGSFFFMNALNYDDAAKRDMVPKGRSPIELSKILDKCVQLHIDPVLDWNAETVEIALGAFAETSGLTRKEIFMTLRVILTGHTASPPLIESAVVLGKETCRERVLHASATLRAMKTRVSDV
jgi:glutamyl-tRNA synthetase